MSNNPTNPLAHLRLDQFDAAGFSPDRGVNAHHGKIMGHPKLLPDDRFGAVIQLTANAQKPSYLKLSDLIYHPNHALAQQAISISVWLRTTQSGGSLCSCDGNAWWELSLSAQGTVQWLTYGDGNQTDLQTSSTQVNDGHWHHVAVSFDPHQAQKSIYIDGQPEAIAMRQARPGSASVIQNADGTTQEINSTAPNSHFPLAGTEAREVLLGATPSANGSIDTASLFSGELAALRLFNSALPISASDLMTADQQSSFRDSHPLDIALSDDNEASVIVISDDPRAQILHLDLRNTSPWPMQLLVPKSNRPSADNFHFSLRFRPGVLSSASLAGQLKLSNSEDWLISAPEQQPDRTICLYFLRTASTVKELAATASLRLSLEGISADGAHGAHGTKIEAGFGTHFTHQHTSFAAGTRSKHLSIVNHSGKRHIPLHFGVVGSNRILNDGKTANQLRLQLTNTSRDETIRLNPASSDAPTRLILSFSYQDELEQRAWALCTQSQAASINVHPGHRQVAVVASGGVPHFHRISDGWPQKTGLSLSQPLSQKIADSQKVIIRSRADDLANIHSNDSEAWVRGARSKGTRYVEVVPYAIPPKDSLLLIPNHAKLEVNANDGEQSRHWVIGLEEKRQLLPGETLTIDVKGIVTSLPSGLTQGYLHYENVPGHWDGTLNFELQKSALTEQQQRIGIGTDAPNTPLHIGPRRDGATDAELATGGLLQLGATDSNNLVLDNDEILARNDGEASTLYLQPNGGDLKFHHKKEEHAQTVITAEGRVGVGTAKPNTPLHIAPRGDRNTDAEPGYGGLLQLGDTSAKNIVADDNEIMARKNGKTSTLYLQSNGGDLSLHYKKGEHARTVFTEEGRVGIGTSSPSAMLEVSSARGNNANSKRMRANIYVNDTSSKNGVSLSAGEHGPTLSAGGGSMNIFATPKVTAKKTHYYTVNVSRLNALGMKLRSAAVRGSLNVKAVRDSDSGPDMYNLYTDNSSIRYKESIQPHRDDFARILLTQPHQYRIKGAAEKIPDSIGYLAEELHELGLDALVIYDEHGRPDGVDYEKISLYLNEVVKEQALKIEALQAQQQTAKRRQCSGQQQLQAGHAQLQFPKYFSKALRQPNQILSLQLTAMGRSPFTLSYEQNAESVVVYSSCEDGHFAWHAQVVES